MSVYYCIPWLFCDSNYVRRFNLGFRQLACREIGQLHTLKSAKTLIDPLNTPVPFL